MKRKIFISINLSDRDKKGLVRATEEWQNLPVKWTREESLHLTLSFLGFLPDDSLSEICSSVSEAVAGEDIFDVEFERIELGQDKNDPKMIWLSGEANESLRRLQENIEKALGTFVSSKKSFRPHITLGRIRQHKWMELPEIPVIDKKFPLTVSVESVDIMASEFDGEGQEYVIIESCLLK